MRLKHRADMKLMMVENFIIMYIYKRLKLFTVLKLKIGLLLIVVRLNLLIMSLLNLLFGTNLAVEGQFQ